MFAVFPACLLLVVQIMNRETTMLMNKFRSRRSDLSETSWLFGRCKVQRQNFLTRWERRFEGNIE